MIHGSSFERVSPSHYWDFEVKASDTWPAECTKEGDAVGLQALKEFDVMSNCNNFFPGRESSVKVQHHHGCCKVRMAGTARLGTLTCTMETETW